MKTSQALLLTSILLYWMALAPEVHAQSPYFLSTRAAVTNGYLRIQVYHNGGWPLGTNRYEIQFTDSVTPTNWRTLTNFAFTNYSPVTVHEALTNSSFRYYRLRFSP